MIYNFLTDRKVILQKVSCLESVADVRAEKYSQNDAKDETISLSEDKMNSSVATEYTRKLDKAYRYFQDGHIQDVKYHPIPNLSDFVCVSAKALPSMRKDRLYNVTIVICESACSVVTAYCTGPAGLCGCRNHISRTVYCLEDYIHQDLQEDEKKSCTECLQQRNQPRKQNADAQPTNEVLITKKVYRVEKRAKIYKVHEWDCQPISKRIVNPNRAHCLQKCLCDIQQ